MTHIGIDFSLNSPSMCIFKNNEYTFFSFSNNLINFNKKNLPKCIKLHEELKHKKICNISYYERLKDNNYINDERCKIKNANIISNLIISKILEFTSIDESFNLNLEGFAYKSKGNSAIDLIMYASIFRHLILNTFKNCNLNVYSPSSIKMKAGKGNAGKEEMLKYFLTNTINDNLIEKNLLWDWITKNKSLIIKKDNSIEKPFDDLIDSYFICNMTK